MSNRLTPAETYGLEGTVDEVQRRGDASGVHVHHGEAESNDHLASIYESSEGQFAAVVPFIAEGLERGERCLYVADDNSPEEILDALRAGGVDVDAALESGTLSIHTKADTYLRTGEFDADAMLEFWEETLAEARDEDGYAGLRAAAEMTWALEEETGLDRLVRYEALLNTIYPGDDYVVLCQYDRDRFPADVVSDVIRSHPLVVYEGTVCRNLYYQPPEDFFGTDRQPLDVDRTVEGLVSRAETERELDARERQLRTRLEQQEVLADLGQRGLEDQDLEPFLADVTARVVDALDADRAELLEIEPGGRRFRLRESDGLGEGPAGDGTVAADGDTLAGHTLEADEPVIVADLERDDRFDGAARLAGRGVTSSLSAVVGSTADPWGVLAVHARDRRDFSRHDAAFLRNVTNVVATAIDRAERERHQRELYEITADPDRDFESKLDALFDLGCEYFGMELGAMARIDPASDRFEVRRTSGDHEHFEPGLELPLSETYCTAVTDDDVPVGVTDPTGAGYADVTVRREFGIQAYLGTRLELDDGPDRTFFFVSSAPREEPFSESDRTFLHLMGQWVQSQLERQQYERKLEKSNERLEQFAYAASHDLREPLRMVSSYLQLIDRRYDDEFDDEGREFLEFAVDGADRMREMIDALLEYSRVETRGEPFAPVDLDAVFEDVLTDLQFRVEDTDAEVTSGSLPTVRGDPDQLRQVFQNLLDNAIEYSGDAPPRVHVDAERCGTEWVVSVSDHGIGIDPDDADRVFEVFQRLHTQDEHAGTGIGLALCRRIVERHGGDIWVDSDPGEGSTFSLTLPAADRDA